jgi:hypothetical protein
MKTKNVLFVLAVVMVFSLLLGCDSVFSKSVVEKNPEENPVEENPEDNTVPVEEPAPIQTDIWAETDFIRSPEEARALLEEYMESMYEYRYYVISGVETIVKQFERGFISPKGEPQASEVQLYLFTMVYPELPGSQPQQALVSGDFRLGVFWGTSAKEVADGLQRLDVYIQQLIDAFNCGYVRSPEELRALLEERLVEEGLSTRTEPFHRLVIVDVETTVKKIERGFKISPKGEPQACEVRFYLFTLVDPEAPPEQQPGFALLCDDMRVGTFFATVYQGNWYADDPFLNLFQAGLDRYIWAQIESFNNYGIGGRGY